MEYYWAIKKNEIMPFAETWIDLEIITLSEISQRNTNIMTSLIREMQSKTTVRYHFMLVRMADIQKSTNNKCQRGCGEKGTLLHC